MEGADSVGVAIGGAPFRRIAPCGGRDQREDADPASQGDGGRWHRQAKGFQGSPASRRVRTDAIRPVALCGVGTALRMGSAAYEAHRSAQGRHRRKPARKCSRNCAALRSATFGGLNARLKFGCFWFVGVIVVCCRFHDDERPSDALITLTIEHVTTLLPKDAARLVIPIALLPYLAQRCL